MPTNQDITKSKLLGIIRIEEDNVTILNEVAANLIEKADINNAMFCSTHGQNAFENIQVQIKENTKYIFGSTFVSVSMQQREYGETDKLDDQNLINIAKLYNKKIVLIAKGASGKDFLVKRLVDLGLNKEVSYTTRPKRDGEQDGVDYHYVTEEQMAHLRDNGQLIQWSTFGNGYTYATEKNAFEKGDLMILTPKGLNKFSPYYRAKMLVVYIDISDDVRRERLMKRSDAHDTERRIRDDKEDFDGFNNWDIKITNPEF